MVYIREDKRNLKASLICKVAECGFYDLGYEIVHFSNIGDIEPTRDDIVVGFLGDIIGVLKKFDITLPVIDYPEELKDFFGREIKIEPSLRELWYKEKADIFVKPAQGFKQFSGRVILNMSDYIGIVANEDLPVYTSPVVDIRSEWRCYVRYGELLCAKNYKGDFTMPPKKEFIRAAIEAYQSAPAGYALDVGVLADGTNIVIEVNDGFSLGTYGIGYIQYAKLLCARWSELMEVKDPLR